MRKIYITLGILLLTTFTMAYLYFSNLNTEQNANELSLQAVANHSSIVFCFENDKSFYEILSGQELLQNLLGEEKSSLLKNLQQQLLGIPAVFSAINGQKTYIGVSAKNNLVNFTIATQLKSGVDATALLNRLMTKKLKITKNKSGYQLRFADDHSIYFDIKENLILISNDPSEITVNLAPQKTAQTDFASYIKTNSRFNKNNLANLYLNFNEMPTLLKNILNTPVNGELYVFNNQNSYAALNYNFSKEKLLFNGNTDIGDGQNYYQLFVDLTAQPLNIDNVFPQKTANYVMYAVNDYAKWQTALNKWMAVTKQDEKIKDKIASIDQKYRIDLEQVFPKYFKNQFATFQLNTGEKFGVIALTNGEKVSQLLLDLSADYAPDVKIFKEPYVPFAYFGEPFKKFERPFYTIIDNYLVMANHASSIQSFLTSYRSNSLLANDEDYLLFNDQLSSDCTISFYVNNKNSADLFSRHLKMPYFKQYQSKSGFKLYNAFCYQLIADKGKFLTNLLLYKNPKKTIATDTTITNQ